MTRIDEAVAELELLDRWRAATDNPNLGQDIERDLVDLYIRDLDPDIDPRSESRSEPWLVRIGFVVIGIGPYAVLIWLLWPGR